MEAEVNGPRIVPPIRELTLAERVEYLEELVLNSVRLQREREFHSTLLVGGAVIGFCLAMYLTAR